MTIIAKKQGELDGLCGIYSVTNAIMLLTEIKPSFTFHYALKSMFKDKNPMSVVDGFEIGTLKDVLSRTIKYLNSGEAPLEDKETGEQYIPSLDFKIPFWQTEPDRTAFQKTIMEAKKTDTVAILGYSYNNGDSENDYSHWTVIKNVTESNLMTFDSDQESTRISWDKILIISNNSNLSKHAKRPFLIHPQNLVLITNE